MLNSGFFFDDVKGKVALYVKQLYVHKTGTENISQLLTYFLIAFLGNFLLIPYILETSQVRKRRISDVCSLHWTCNVPNVHAVDPGIRHILHSQPERLTKRCKSDFLTMDYAFKNICK